MTFAEAMVGFEPTYTRFAGGALYPLGHMTLSLWTIPASTDLAGARAYPSAGSPSITAAGNTVGTDHSQRTALYH